MGFVRALKCLEGSGWSRGQQGQGLGALVDFN